MFPRYGFYEGPSVNLKIYLLGVGWLGHHKPFYVWGSEFGGWIILLCLTVGPKLNPEVFLII